MARDTQSIVKMSRREGYALHPKAHKALDLQGRIEHELRRQHFSAADFAAAAVGDDGDRIALVQQGDAQQQTGLASADDGNVA